jgi:HSP20 family protein
VEVTTRGDDLVLNADLPGVKPEDVRVETDGNNLIIGGESRSGQEKEENGYWYTERSYGSFYRSIPLPQGLNTEKAQAEFRNGVLEIVFPGGAKVLMPPHRRIEIRTSRQAAQPEGQMAQPGQQGTSPA